MKRFGNLYSQVYDMNNIRLAHQNAKKGKGWYREVKMVDKDTDWYLQGIQRSLKNKTYSTSKYTVFTKVEGPKERTIFKLPYYPDRIAQWSLMLVIEPYLIRTFTADTYSAIPGRGVHLCLERIKTALKENPSGTKYCLKMDITKYYESINHEILKGKYEKIFKDKDLLWLLGEIIDSTEGNVGVPIGNYVSQYSGNLYLSDFDHWIKEEKQRKHYYRYMDGLVIFGETKEELHELCREIIEILGTKLKLRIKDNYQVFPTEVRGVDFLGYRIFPDYVLLRKSIAKTYKKKMMHLMNKMNAGLDMTYSEWCSFNSYKGWLKYCNSYRLYEKYTKPLEKHAEQYYLKYVKGVNIDENSTIYSEAGIN